MEPTIALRVRGVRKAYDNAVALDGLDLDIGSGEICALIGPNGAGKTTLVSIVAGLRKADAGSVEVYGEDALRSSRSVRRMIGLAPQELAVYPTTTVREGLRFFGELARRKRADVQRRIEHLAERLELTELLDRRAGLLSGGEKRRVHTAMALMHDPKLLLLDEPTVGVDIESRARLLAFVRELADEGCAICYTTHYLHEVETLDATVAIIDAGRIVARGTCQELLDAHRDVTIELSFDGDAPTVDLGVPAHRSGEILRLTGGVAQRDLGHLLSRLGDDVGRLRGVEVVQPGLESVFLAMTGKAFDGAVLVEEPA